MSFEKLRSYNPDLFRVSYGCNLKDPFNSFLLKNYEKVLLTNISGINFIFINIDLSDVKVMEWVANTFLSEIVAISCYTGQLYYTDNEHPAPCVDESSCVIEDGEIVNMASGHEDISLVEIYFYSCLAMGAKKVTKEEMEPFVNMCRSSDPTSVLQAMHNISASVNLLTAYEDENGDARLVLRDLFLSLFDNEDSVRKIELYAALYRLVSDMEEGFLKKDENGNPLHPELYDFYVLGREYKLPEGAKTREEFYDEKFQAWVEFVHSNQDEFKY